jgi:hypothetical protein
LDIRRRISAGQAAKAQRSRHTKAAAKTGMANAAARKVGMIPQQKLQAPNIPKAEVLEFKTGGDLPEAAPSSTSKLQEVVLDF